jgi:hypothetical protein
LSCVSGSKELLDLVKILLEIEKVLSIEAEVTGIAR